MGVIGILYLDYGIDPSDRIVIRVVPGDEREASGERREHHQSGHQKHRGVSYSGHGKASVTQSTNSVGC